MKERNLGGVPAGFDGVADDLESAWLVFSHRLGFHLTQMDGDADQPDTLVIEVPTGADPEGCAPYAQVTAYAPGRVRLEMSGDWFLAPIYVCSNDELMRELGWTWEEQGNWWLDTEDAVAAARIVVASLRGCFGITHPQLMTFHAFGPQAHLAHELGLTATADLTFETSSEDIDVTRPRDREHLVDLVGQALLTIFEELPPLDDDGDYVIAGPEQPIWVRVLRETPAVQFMAVPTFDVHSRRATALELSILNRDSLYAKWDLRDRMVWLTLTVPADPFVGEHLADMYRHFVSTLVAERADLALRCGGKVVQ